MISDEDRLVLKDLLGTRWVVDVKAILAGRGVLSPVGQPYSTGNISNVYTGRLANPAIEDAIWTLAAERKAEKDKQEKINEKRRLALKTKKPAER